MADKTHQHFIPVLLTEREENLLLNNSIERVINTSKRIALMSKDEDAEVNFDDWEFLKGLTEKLWALARNEAFKRRNP